MRIGKCKDEDKNRPLWCRLVIWGMGRCCIRAGRRNRMNWIERTVKNQKISSTG